MWRLFVILEWRIRCACRNHTISCIFVDGKYHRKGVGKKLFDMVIVKLRERGVTEITLDASYYGCPFYTSLGFRTIGQKTSYRGIVDTLMKLTLQ